MSLRVHNANTSLPGKFSSSLQPTNLSSFPLHHQSTKSQQFQQSQQSQQTQKQENKASLKKTDEIDCGKSKKVEMTRKNIPPPVGILRNTSRKQRCHGGLHCIGLGFFDYGNVLQISGSFVRNIQYALLLLVPICGYILAQMYSSSILGLSSFGIFLYGMLDLIDQDPSLRLPSSNIRSQKRFFHNPMQPRDPQHSVPSSSLGGIQTTRCRRVVFANGTKFYRLPKPVRRRQNSDENTCTIHSSESGKNQSATSLRRYDKEIMEASTLLPMPAYNPADLFQTRPVPEKGGDENEVQDENQKRVMRTYNKGVVGTLHCESRRPLEIKNHI